MKISEKTYYKYMNSFDSESSFEQVHRKWFDCFEYILRDRRVGYTKSVISELFYDWEMWNWDSMHIENSPEYNGKSKKELFSMFCGETRYICDRASYDRLFRCHWLFRMAFENEIHEFGLHPFK